MLRDLEKSIEIISPIYRESIGNCTLISTGERDILLEKSINTVIREICKSNFFDLDQMKKMTRSIIPQKNNLPLYLGGKNTYIQVKVRKPIGKHDGANGLIAFNSIRDIEELVGENSSIIYLKSGSKIKVLCKKKTVEKNIKIGKILENQVLNMYNQNKGEDILKTAYALLREHIILESNFNKIK